MTQEDVVQDNGDVIRTITITQTFSAEQYKRMQEREATRATQLQAQADDATQEAQTLAANVATSQTNVGKSQQIKV